MDEYVNLAPAVFPAPASQLDNPAESQPADLFWEFFKEIRENPPNPCHPCAILGLFHESVR